MSAVHVLRSVAFTSVLLAGAISPQLAMAFCSAAGTLVTCSGAANPLSPSYYNAASNLKVTVDSSASFGVLPGIGGTAMSLTGTGTTLTNGGTIDPAVLGQLSILSSGLVVANPAGSIVQISNLGRIRGTSGQIDGTLANLTGMALTAGNGPGGTTTLLNSGLIDANALMGFPFVGEDIPVIAAYGGAQIQFTNTGTIVGRTAFQSSPQGNTFINAGTISGGVSLGANSNNTFVAEDGSVIIKSSSPPKPPLTVNGISQLMFAPAGQIDGGANGNNTLKLQSSGSNSTTFANASADNYVNFQHLEVESGNWSLTGALASDDIAFNGGVARIDDVNVFGTVQVTANGGAIEGTPQSSLVITNDINLGANGLSLSGSGNFSLTGALTGTGALNMKAISSASLAGNSTYTGGTNLSSGALATIGNSAAPLGTGEVRVSGTGMLNILEPLPNAVVQSGGSIVPGAGTTPQNQPSIGKFTQTGGVLMISANAPNAASSSNALNVQGTAQLGGTLELFFAAPPSAGQTFVVLNSADGITGQFSQVNVFPFNFPAGLVLTPQYTNNQVTVHVSAPATQLQLQGPTLATAGEQASYTVTAADVDGNLASSYSGTLNITASDPLASLPASVTLINGTATFNATLRSSGNVILVATDTSNDTIKGSASVTVAKAATTTTLSASPASSSAPGQNVSLTAHVALPAGNTAKLAGNVNFTDGGAAIAGCGAVVLDAAGNAQCNTTNLPIGTRNLRADYVGDANTAASSGTATQTITKTGTSIAFNITPQRVMAGQSFTIHVTVSADSASPAKLTKAATAKAAPAGTVTVLEGSTTLASGTLDASGAASITVPPLEAGEHSLQIVYSGSAELAATQIDTTLTVAEKTATSATPVPTLSTAMLVTLMTLLGAFGMVLQRGRNGK